MKTPGARSAMSPPGPRGYPVVGVFPRARKDPLGFFLDSARRYGDVVSMRFGSRRVYLLSHPDDIKHVLQDSHRLYGKSAPARRIRPFFGDSLTTIDGDDWRRRRRLMRPTFQPKQLAFVGPAVTDATDEMLDRWQHVAARGEAVDVLGEMRGVTRAIILRLLFGDVAPAAARVIGEALDLALERADRRLWSALGWLDVPTPRYWRVRRALRSVDRLIGGIIAHARRLGAPPETLLSMLLEARDAESGQPMDDAELRDELKALLVAGHTTTASTLAWVWYVLWQEPGAQRTLQREVGSLRGGRPCVDDLPALTYTRSLLEEILRLYPPTWVTARAPLRDDGIRGYRIAAGSIVLLSPFVTHRHPGFWKDPQRFDPERFTPEASARRAPFAYFPFGGGPRSCIGAWLASVAMQLVVAMVAQRYQPRLVPGSRVDMRPGLTLRPDPRVPMLLR